MWIDLEEDIAEEFADLVVVDTYGLTKGRVKQPGRRLPPDAANRFLSASDEEREHMRQTMRPLLRPVPAAIERPRARPKDVRPGKLADLRDRIVDLLRRGFSQRETARMVNVSRATVARALRDPMRRGRPRAA